jgi:hypothetical protein
MQVIHQTMHPILVGYKRSDSCPRIVMETTKLKLDMRDNPAVINRSLSYVACVTSEDDDWDGALMKFAKYTTKVNSRMEIQN